MLFFLIYLFYQIDDYFGISIYNFIALFYIIKFIFSLYQSCKSIFLSLFKKLSIFSLFAKIPICHPTHTFRISWDFLHLLIVILMFFVIPINVFFEVDLMEGWGEARKMVGVFFLADGMVKLNTAYYSKVY